MKNSRLVYESKMQQAPPVYLLEAHFHPKQIKSEFEISVRPIEHMNLGTEFFPEICSKIQVLKQKQ